MLKKTRFYPFIVQHVLSFLCGEGYFVFLNHEWKKEYIRQYGKIHMSPSIICTVKRYKWATQYKARALCERDIHTILMHRCSKHHEAFKTKITLIDALIQDGFIKYVIEYAIYREDLNVFIRAYNYEHMLTDHHIEIDLNRCTFFNLFAFARGIYSKINHRSISIQTALQLAMQTENHRFIDLYCSSFSISLQARAKVLSYAFYHRHHAIASKLVKKYKFYCSLHLKKEVVRHDDVDGLELLFSLNTIKQSGIGGLFRFAIVVSSFRVVDHMIECYLFPRAFLLDSLRLARRLERTKIIKTIARVVENEDCPSTHIIQIYPSI